MTINELIQRLGKMPANIRDADASGCLDKIMGLLGYWSYKVWDRDDIRNSIDNNNHEVDEEDVEILFAELRCSDPLSDCSAENEILDNQVEKYFAQKKA